MHPLTRFDSEPIIADVLLVTVIEVAALDWSMDDVWSALPPPICTFFPVLGSTIFSACFCLRPPAGC